MHGMMDAYVLHGLGDIGLEKRVLGKLGENEVRIKVMRAGICGSDIHYYQHGRVGSFAMKSPMVLGHELSGDVVELGEAVRTLAVGDRIAVEPAFPCGKCEACRSNRYNLCINMRVLGSASTVPHLDGAFAQYVCVPASSCLHLPDEFSYQEGALLEPLAVAIHAVNRAGGVKGKRVLITGGGTIGQMLLKLCQAYGADVITLSDPHPFKRDFAIKQGSTAVIDPTIEQHQTNTHDVVFEASGSPQALILGFQFAKRGATIVQIGTYARPFEIDFNLFVGKELQVYGSFRYANAFQTGIDLILTNRIDPNPIVTHTFPFNELPSALNLAIASSPTHPPLKIHIRGYGF